MAIDGALRGKLAPGTRLVAHYKAVEQVAEVVAAEEGALQFRLADGRTFARYPKTRAEVREDEGCRGCPRGAC